MEMKRQPLSSVLFLRYTWVLCNDLDKKQWVLSDLDFTLVPAENADSFLLRRKCSAIFILGPLPNPGQLILQCKAYSSVCCGGKGSFLQWLSAALSSDSCTQISPVLCSRSWANTAHVTKSQLTQAPWLLDRTMWGLLVDQSSGAGGAEPDGNAAEGARVTE